MNILKNWIFWFITTIILLLVFIFCNLINYNSNKILNKAETFTDIQNDKAQNSPMAPKDSSKKQAITTKVQSTEFSTDLAFSFKDHPGINFKIAKINKTQDPKGSYNYYSLGITNPALVTIDLEITNDSDTNLNANFLQVLYSVKTDDGIQTRIAPHHIHTSYLSNSMTSIKVEPTFIIPNDVQVVSVVTGIYPPIIYSGAGELLSNSVDAFTVDFEKKTARYIES